MLRSSATVLVQCIPHGFSARELFACFAKIGNLLPSSVYLLHRHIALMDYDPLYSRDLGTGEYLLANGLTVTISFMHQSVPRGLDAKDQSRSTGGTLASLAHETDAYQYWGDVMLSGQEGDDPELVQIEKDYAEKQVTLAAAAAKQPEEEETTMKEQVDDGQTKRGHDANEEEKLVPKEKVLPGDKKQARRDNDKRVVWDANLEPPAAAAVKDQGSNSLEQLLADPNEFPELPSKPRSTSPKMVRPTTPVAKKMASPQKSTPHSSGSSSALATNRSTTQTKGAIVTPASRREDPPVLWVTPSLWFTLNDGEKVDDVECDLYHALGHDDFWPRVYTNSGMEVMRYIGFLTLEDRSRVLDMLTAGLPPAHRLGKFGYPNNEPYRTNLFVIIDPLPGNFARLNVVREEFSKFGTVTKVLWAKKREKPLGYACIEFKSAETCKGLVNSGRGTADGEKEVRFGPVPAYLGLDYATKALVPLDAQNEIVNARFELVEEGSAPVQLVVLVEFETQAQAEAACKVQVSLEGSQVRARMYV